MDGMSRLREGQSGGTDNNAMVFLLCFLHGLVFVLPLDGMFPFLREKFVKTIEAARCETCRCRMMIAMMMTPNQGGEHGCHHRCPCRPLMHRYLCCDRAADVT